MNEIIKTIRIFLFKLFKRGLPVKLLLVDVDKVRIQAFNSHLPPNIIIVPCRSLKGEVVQIIDCDTKVFLKEKK